MKGPGLGRPREGRTEKHSSWSQVCPSKRMLGIKICLGSKNHPPPHPGLDLFKEETLESI